MENKTILSVGHLFSYKGFDYLLKVWQVLEKKYPNWNLKIVGSGEEEENLKILLKHWILKIQLILFLVLMMSLLL